MMAAGERDDRAERAVGAACVLAAAFIVYASLVPLAYTPQHLHVALQRMWPPSWHAVDAMDRADWLANLVMFAALAFTGLAALGPARHRFEAVARAVGVMGGFAVLALAIEFAQLWFPPRSVTANDLVAELAGIGLGGAAWVALGPRVMSVARPYFDNAWGARRALAAVFIVGYVGAALFPFDVVVAPDEVRAKLMAGMAGWWMAPAACELRSLCVANVVAHLVAAVAFGLAWRLARSEHAGGGWRFAILLGAALGLAIEAAQLFIVSGIAQGSSVVARAAGVAAGYRLAGRARPLIDAARARALTRPVLVATALGYAFALVLINRLATTQWLGLDEALARLVAIPVVPFYYHYYVSEQRALASAIVHLAMYAPVGAWLAVVWRRRGGRALAAWCAGLLALVIEAAKLMAGRQADPTDLLLASIAGYTAYALVRWLLELGQRSEGRPLTLLPPVSFGVLTPYAFALVIAVVLGVLAYPGPRTLLALGLAVFALALARDPALWLVVVPALLPVLDLAQWTGALFLDEFDLLVMTALSVLCFRAPLPNAARWPPGLAVAIAVASLLTLIALLRGLSPWGPLDADTFASVHSPANAWRVGRGMLWCAALVLLVRRWSGTPGDDLLRWARGMTIGLALAGVVMLWERTTFAGWTDFGLEYRAVGALAAASTAGAQTESFLAMAIPFALLIAATTASPLWRCLGVLALLLAAYAITATVSRAALAAAIVSVLLFSVGLALRIPLSARARRSLVLLLPATALLLGLAVLVTGQRFAQSVDDFAARRAHWTRLLDNSADHLGETLLGHGLGAYPRHYYWTASPGERPSLFSYRQEGERTFARISPGRSTNLDQVVDVAPGEQVTLEIDVRSPAERVPVIVSLCAKWILYPTRCQDLRLETAGGGEWHRYRLPLAAREPPAARLSRPTEKLSIALPRAASAVVDVSRVHLYDERGADLVRNGSFAAPGAYWLVSAGDLWAWNTFDLFVEVVFEQGWIALAALLVALAYAFTVMGERGTRGDLVAAACAAGLAGFLVPSLFDAVIDDPRLRLLLGLAVALPLLRPKSPASLHVHPPRRAVATSAM
jgi:hypothetical protein